MTLRPLSNPHTVEVPFVKAVFGGVTFGLTGKRNSKTGVVVSDFITSLTIKKYGSGAVNQYTMVMKYIITPEADPNYVDMVISKAYDRKITFTYGDLTQPEYSYKNEEGIITDIVPDLDFEHNTITYTITATSSTTLAYSTKRNFPSTKEQPSQVILRVLYGDYGLLELLPGMRDREVVTKLKNWIPQNDKVVEISEKRDIAPLDYILYLVSLMVGDSPNEYFFLKLFDSINTTLPHFEIVSTKKKKESQMLKITIGYPGSIPVFKFTVQQKSSIALLVEYREKVDKNLFQDYSLRGDLVSQNYYSSDVHDGSPSEKAKSWWDKMLAFPISANLITGGLFVPAEIIQSVYLDIYFYGKKYNYSGEYLILEQEDSINSGGYRSSLNLLRIEGEG